MKYVAWLWHNTQGTRFNSSVRIVFGTAQVALGLLMVWLSKRFIDETIHTGSRDAIAQMIVLLALTVLGRILLRQVYYYMTTLATTRKSNELRLNLFAKLFSRRLFDENELHSGDVTSRLSKDIDAVSGVVAETIPQMVVTGIQLLGAFLLMRFFDAWLAWALVIFTPLAIVLGKFVAHKLKRMTLDIREKESQIQMHVQEGVEYNAVLRSLGGDEDNLFRIGGRAVSLHANEREVVLSPANIEAYAACEDIRFVAFLKLEDVARLVAIDHRPVKGVKEVFLEVVRRKSEMPMPLFVRRVDGWKCGGVCTASGEGRKT